MTQDEKLLSTKEVAERLGLTVTTIYQYVKNQKLKPVYDDWQVDETMLFYLSDVQRLENQRPGGFTTAQVADELGIHQTTVSKQIKEGKIKADKVKYKGRMTYFVSNDVLEELKMNYNNNRSNKDYFYQKKWNYYLFQSFTNVKNNDFGRVEKVTKDSGHIITDNGEQIKFDQLKEKGFYPREKYVNIKTINKPGDISFQFKLPNSLHSPVYEVIELLYRNLSYKNMKLFIEDDYINIQVKPVLLKLSNDVTYALLQDHVVKGKVTERHNGILLDSCLESILIHMNKEQKRRLKHESKRKGITVDQLIVSIIDEHYKE